MVATGFSLKNFSMTGKALLLLIDHQIKIRRNENRTFPDQEY